MAIPPLFFIHLRYKLNYVGKHIRETTFSEVINHRIQLRPIIIHQFHQIRPRHTRTRCRGDGHADSSIYRTQVQTIQILPERKSKFY